jgi:hypothetical protein
MVEVDENTLASGTPVPEKDFSGVICTTDELEWDGFDGFAHKAFVDGEEEEPYDTIQ